VSLAAGVIYFGYPPKYHDVNVFRWGL